MAALATRSTAALTHKHITSKLIPWKTLLHGVTCKLLLLFWPSHGHCCAGGVPAATYQYVECGYSESVTGCRALLQLYLCTTPASVPHVCTQRQSTGRSSCCYQSLLLKAVIGCQMYFCCCKVSHTVCLAMATKVAVLQHPHMPRGSSFKHSSQRNPTSIASIQQPEFTPPIIST